MAASTVSPSAVELSSSSVRPVSLANFKFNSIGQLPSLSLRLSDPDPNDRSPSPMDDSPVDDLDKHRLKYPPTSSSRPTLFQSLANSPSNGVVDPILASPEAPSVFASVVHSLREGKGSPATRISAGSPRVVDPLVDTTQQKSNASSMPSASTSSAPSSFNNDLTGPLAEETSEDVKPFIPTSTSPLHTKRSTSLQSNVTPPVPTNPPPCDLIGSPANGDVASSLLESPLFTSLDRRAAGISEVYDRFNKSTVEWSQLLDESLSASENLHMRMDTIKVQADAARLQGERLLEEAAKAREFADQLAASAAVAQADATVAHSKVNKAREHTDKMKSWLVKVNNWNSDMQAREKTSVEALRADISRLQGDVETAEERAVKTEEERKSTQETTRAALAETEKLRGDIQRLEKQLTEMQSTVDKERLEKRDILTQLISVQKDIYNRERSNLLNEASREQNQAATTSSAPALSPPKAAKLTPSPANAASASQATRSISPSTTRSTPLSGSVLSATMVPRQSGRESQSSAAASTTATTVARSLSDDVPAPASKPFTSRASSHVSAPKGFVHAQTVVGREVNTDMPFAGTTLASERSEAPPPSLKIPQARSPSVKTELVSPIVPSLSAKPALPITTSSPAVTSQSSSSASREPPPLHSHREGVALQRNRYPDEHGQAMRDSPLEQTHTSADSAHSDRGPPSSSTSTHVQKRPVRRPSLPQAKQPSSRAGPSKDTHAPRPMVFIPSPASVPQEKMITTPTPYDIYDAHWSVAPVHFGDGGWQSAIGDRAMPVPPSRMNDDSRNWPPQLPYSDDRYSPGLSSAAHRPPPRYCSPPPPRDPLHRVPEPERYWCDSYMHPSDGSSVLGKRSLREEPEEPDSYSRPGLSPRYRESYRRSPSPVPPLRHDGDGRRPSPSPLTGSHFHRRSFSPVSPTLPYDGQSYSGSYHDRPPPPIERLPPKNTTSRSGDVRVPPPRNVPHIRKRQAIEDSVEPMSQPHTSSINSNNASLLERIDLGKRGPRVSRPRQDVKHGAGGDDRGSHSRERLPLATRMSNAKSLEERMSSR